MDSFIVLKKFLQSIICGNHEIYRLGLFEIITKKTVIYFYKQNVILLKQLGVLNIVL